MPKSNYKMGDSNNFQYAQPDINVAREPPRTFNPTRGGGATATASVGNAEKPNKSVESSGMMQALSSHKTLVICLAVIVIALIIAVAYLATRRKDEPARGGGGGRPPPKPNAKPNTAVDEKPTGQQPTVATPTANGPSVQELESYDTARRRRQRPNQTVQWKDEQTTPDASQKAGQVDIDDLGLDEPSPRKSSRSSRKGKSKDKDKKRRHRSSRKSGRSAIDTIDAEDDNIMNLIDEAENQLGDTQSVKQTSPRQTIDIDDLDLGDDDGSDYDDEVDVVDLDNISNEENVPDMVYEQIKVPKYVAAEASAEGIDELNHGTIGLDVIKLLKGTFTGPMFRKWVGTQNVSRKLTKI